MKPVYEIFQEKYQQQKLAHFYVLKSSDLQSQQKSEHALLAWPQICFAPILNGKNMLSHADFLLMSDEPTTTGREKSYSIEEMSQINEFLQYRPLSLKYKFIIMPSTHLMSEAVCNHLLKVLEEPPSYAVFLLINQKNNKLISTVESRAVNLRISASELNSLVNEQVQITPIDLQSLKKLSLSELVEKLKENESMILSEIANNIAKSQKIELLQEYQKLISYFQTAVAWNDTVYNRYFSLYNLLQQL